MVKCKHDNWWVYLSRYPEMNNYASAHLACKDCYATIGLDTEEAFDLFSQDPKSVDFLLRKVYGFSDYYPRYYNYLKSRK